VAFFRKSGDRLGWAFGAIAERLNIGGHQGRDTLISKMEYVPINAPFEVDFKKSNKKLLRAHFEWFVAEIPLRLRQLQRAIDSSASTPFNLDFSDESMLALGDWLARIVETRVLTKGDIDEWRKSFPAYIEPPSEVPTELSELVGVDVGIYLAEAMRHHRPQLKWEVILKNRRHAEYGMPVLTGFVHEVPFDALRIGQGIVLALCKNRDLTQEVARLFDFWLKDAQ
jgi:hypothetical protein